MGVFRAFLRALLGRGFDATAIVLTILLFLFVVLVVLVLWWSWLLMLCVGNAGLDWSYLYTLHHWGLSVLLVVLVLAGSTR